MTTTFTPDQVEEQLGEELDDAIPSIGYQMVPVVGLGGSLASSSDVRAFLAELPPATGLAFVAMLHGGSEGDSQDELVDSLQAVTPLKVMPLRKTTRITPETVYVVPPQSGVRALDGSLVLEKQESGRMPIDLFLRSLADTHGPHSAAVVLSGPGADGTVGIKRIKERGGLTVAQEPGEATESAMTRLAIATGMIDWVLPVREMPARLLSYFRLEPRLRLPPETIEPAEAERPPEGADEASLREVLALLRTRTGRDFGHYKRATVLRRIARRMQVNDVEDMQAYLSCLRTRPGEPAALLQDLLISVTNFFRDADNFGALERRLPALFEDKTANDAVRVWVAACATGEEAYSVAMLLAEYARTLDAPPLIQVFASDLDEDAIQAAREGIYSTAIEADVSPERLRRFFVRESRGYRVRRELRELVLFAVHDALRDSPFSRLDLVSCRNLLIYLNRDAQRRLLDTFHFALVPHGKLFLGSSESVEDGSHLFTVIDKKHHLYGQRPAARGTLPVASGPSTLALALQIKHPRREGPVVVAGPSFAVAQAQRDDKPRPASWGEVHLRLLERLAPPSILVDGEYDIVHLSDSAGRFLQHGGGEPTRNLLRMVHPALRIELRAALYQASQTNAAVDVPPMRVRVGDQEQQLAVRVIPARELSDDLVLVLLQAEDQPALMPSPGVVLGEVDPVAQRLDHELERLKSNLRDTVEQYEASNEELKASNEELQAMNEELRSATEELETSREELQSINEELTTVNYELKSKVEELAHSNSDLQNLMDATSIATVFLDRELRITRFTPSAVTLFNFIPGDLGRPLTDLANQLNYPELGVDARRVLERLVPVEREVGRDDGWYLARMVPYRTAEDRIAGLVLTFVNITERKQAEEMRLWLSAVVTATADGIISFSLDETILSWNNGAERIFGYGAAEAIGRPLSMLAPARTAPDTDPLIERIRSLHDDQKFDTVRLRKDGKEVPISLTVSPIRDGAGQVIAGTAIVRDVTEAHSAAAALRDSEGRLEQVVAQTRQALKDQQQGVEAIAQELRQLLDQVPQPQPEGILGVLELAESLKRSISQLLAAAEAAD